VALSPANAFAAHQFAPIASASRRRRSAATIRSNWIDILSAAGDKIDADLNAGFDVLRGVPSAGGRRSFTVHDSRCSQQYVGHHDDIHHPRQRFVSDPGLTVQLTSRTPTIRISCNADRRMERA